MIYLNSFENIDSGDDPNQRKQQRQQARSKMFYQAEKQQSGDSDLYQVLHVENTIDGAKYSDHQRIKEAVNRRNRYRSERIAMKKPAALQEVNGFVPNRQVHGRMQRINEQELKNNHTQVWGKYS